jgi:hypothetical protein
MNEYVSNDEESEQNAIEEETDFIINFRNVFNDLNLYYIIMDV